MDKINQQVAEYMRSHWPSEVRPEWRVTNEMYPAILQKILQDFTKNATQSKQFFRICGQSGSGKTSQLLPAVAAYFESRQAKPILVAARLLAPYHPFAEEIKSAYGVTNFRSKTNEVSTILMFFVLKELISLGYDIILDVTLLDPIVEGALMNMLTAQDYQTSLTMVAISKEISDTFIGKRKNRTVTKSTAAEFWRATRLALDFYIKNYPEMPITIWSAWDSSPIYAGPIGHLSVMKIIEKYWLIPKLPGETNEPALRQAKISYFSN
ncbi:MAG: zeta toxin family protein [Candidatus Nomurabacteria bacterium]|nr:zeta toxin family protein [Candidatus Nomurabacteria bacterium]